MRSSAAPAQRQLQRCPRGTASNGVGRVGSEGAADDAGGNGSVSGKAVRFDGAVAAVGVGAGAATVAAAAGVDGACDLCQRQLRHGSWWPNRDEKRICAYVASQRRVAVDSVDRVWFCCGANGDAAAAGGAGAAAADVSVAVRWYPPGAHDPRNYADSCSCPCHCKGKRRQREIVRRVAKLKQQRKMFRSGHKLGH